MDFHCLTRRELQALCKTNKIPANITNAAMADALKALHLVEGIEEFLKQTQSETVQSSVESPEKAVIISPSVPRTSCRTSTRLKQMKEEPKSLQTSIRTDRGTRRRLAGEVEEGNNEVPESPAAVQSSRRRGAGVRLKEESAVRRVYCTRRSVRLSEKKLAESNKMEKQRMEPIKIDSFSEEMSQTLVAKSKESLVVLENTSLPGVDSQTISQEDSERTDDLVISVKKLDVSSEGERYVKDDLLEGKGDNYKADDTTEKSEEVSEALDESDVVLSPEEHSNRSMIKEDGDVEDELNYDNNCDDDSETKSEVGNERCDSTDILLGENLEKALDMQNEVPENKVYVFPSDTENPNEILKMENGVEIELNGDKDMGSGDIAAVCTKKEVLENKVDVFQIEDSISNELSKLEIKEELDSDKDVESEISAALISSGNVCSIVVDPVVCPQSSAQDTNNSPTEWTESDMLSLSASAAQDQNQDIEGHILDGDHFETSYNRELHSETYLESGEVQDLELSLATETISRGEILGDDAAADSRLEYMICSKQMVSRKEPNISEILNYKDFKEVVDQPVMHSIDSIDVFTPNNDLDSGKFLTKESGMQIAVDFFVQDNLFISNGMGPRDVNDMPERELTHVLPCLPILNDEFTSNFSASNLAAYPLPNQFPSSLVKLLDSDNIARPTSLTSVKKSSSKTPETIRRMSHVSDDKENIDHSGRKLDLTKDEGKKHKKENAEGDKLKPLNETSLRLLSKMLKEKLQIMNNVNDQGENNIAKVAKSRPALQTL